MNTRNFYRAFENKFRGSRELIKSRLEVYLPFVMPLKEIYEECSVLDIGCGRGEWLELMSENEFIATGVDLDDGMLEACKELGLNAINKDALLTLQELPDESQVIVSGFHIAEHLPFETLLEIVKEAKRVLKPAGLLIMETPNPANIYVGINSFYFDPTHTRPIPSELFSFLPEFYGYKRIKVLYLNESNEIKNNSFVTLYDVYRNSSPDHAVVAQKGADEKLLSSFDVIFRNELGISTEFLCNRFENDHLISITPTEVKALEARAINAEKKTLWLETKTLDLVDRVINAEFELAEKEKIVKNLQTDLMMSNKKFTEIEDQLKTIYSSRSWRLMGPYRKLGNLIRKIVGKAVLD